MAVYALRRSAPVPSNRLSVSLDLVLMTLHAAHLAMRTVERKGGLVVVERSRAPLRDRMASGAVFFLPSAHELAAMHVFVTVRALPRRAGEIGGGLSGAAFCTFWLVTTRARNALVRPFECELSGGVIEGPQFLPLPHVVASLAR
jgi:hypothetical protein